MLTPRFTRSLWPWACLMLLACALAGVPDAQLRAAPPESHGTKLYAPDPTHLWNRIHQAFHLRETFREADRDVAPGPHEFNPDDLDPFYWGHRDYLLTGPSHQEALALLDEFLNTHGERLITAPLPRAFLQRDLWALF